MRTLRLGRAGAEQQSCGFRCALSPFAIACQAAVDAFYPPDLDGTIIRPMNGNSFPKDSYDWELCGGSVVRKLRDLHRDGWVSLLDHGTRFSKLCC